MICEKASLPTPPPTWALVKGPYTASLKNMILKSERSRMQNTEYRIQKPLLMANSQKLIAILALPLILLFSGCYSFKDVSIKPDVKTFYVKYIENKARYTNPQLSPQVTDKLRQKIVNQTRLSPVQSEGADYDIGGVITGYDVSTSGISGQQASISRLTVTITVTLKNNKDPEDKKTNFEASVSRNFDFNAQLTLSQAEPQLNESIIKNMVDEMFNRIFSNW
jgi:outer membrane lipopolysaccharide assembly protein LptE/RlpB